MSFLTPEQMKQARATAQTAMEPQLRALLLHALDDIETLDFWHEGVLDALGHRTDQVCDVEEAVDEYENGWREDPDEARQDRWNLPRLFKNLKNAIAGRGPMSGHSRAVLEKKAEGQPPMAIGGRSSLQAEMIRQGVCHG